MHNLIFVGSVGGFSKSAKTVLYWVALIPLRMGTNVLFIRSCYLAWFLFQKGIFLKKSLNEGKRKILTSFTFRGTKTGIAILVPFIPMFILHLINSLTTNVSSLHKICKNTGFHWPVFSHILCSDIESSQLIYRGN